MDDKRRAQRAASVRLVAPMVIVTRPQDWAQPARDILWPLLAQRERRRVDGA